MLLKLERVVKHFHEGDGLVRAVDDVSLTITPGEMVALYGPSGSGKTTLLLLIAALLKPQAGVIRFAEREVSALSEREASEYLLRDVGFIFQNFHLMPRVNVVENAARKLLLRGMGLRQARAAVVPWLQLVGLGERLQQTPEKLSGGERQRVAIARALAGDPRLILADEPTGNLDSVRSQEIVQLLHSIAHDRDACVLLVTHDRAAAAIADRVCTLRDGRLETGTDGRVSELDDPPTQPATVER